MDSVIFSLLCHSVHNLTLICYGQLKGKIKQNSMKCISLCCKYSVLLILQNSLSQFIITFNLIHRGFLGFFFYLTAELLLIWIFCMNFTLQVSDLHSNTCIENISEHHTLRWWKTKNLLFIYAVLLSSCIILHCGRDKQILVHHLDFDSGQFKLWNTSLKFCILESQHH